MNLRFTLMYLTKLKLNCTKCTHMLYLGMFPITILVSEIVINTEGIPEVVKLTNDVGKIPTVMKRIIVC